MSITVAQALEAVRAAVEDALGVTIQPRALEQRERAANTGECFAPELLYATPLGGMLWRPRVGCFVAVHLAPDTPNAAALAKLELMAKTLAKAERGDYWPGETVLVTFERTPAFQAYRNPAAVAPGVVTLEADFELQVDNLID